MARLAALVRQWEYDPAVPGRLCYLLDHRSAGCVLLASPLRHEGSGPGVSTAYLATCWITRMTATAAAVQQGWWWLLLPRPAACLSMAQQAEAWPVQHSNVLMPCGCVQRAAPVSLTTSILACLICRRYTEESLQQRGVDGLKGPDRAAVQVRVTCSCIIQSFDGCCSLGVWLISMVDSRAWHESVAIRCPQRACPLPQLLLSACQQGAGLDAQLAVVQCTAAYYLDQDSFEDTVYTEEDWAKFHSHGMYTTCEEDTMGEGSRICCRCRPRLRPFSCNKLPLPAA